MKVVGLLCNCSMELDPRATLSKPLINRAFLIDEVLRPSNIRLFLYSPGDVTSLEAVSGYTIDGDCTIPATMPVPRVNANWTYGTRKLIDAGMGYRRFKQWTKENGVEVYVPYEFSELVANKRRAYEAMTDYDETLHPHTEDYRGSFAQLDAFLQRGDCVFLKPRTGNRGNRIFVLRRAEGEFSVKYYDSGEMRVFSPLTLEAARAVIDGGIANRSYVIQEGIDSQRFQGSVFDIRVVMVHDGARWNSILETRVAALDSDLSNIFQRGSSHLTEELLAELFGSDGEREMVAEIERVSLGVAEHLESQFPGELMEIGFDFVLDVARMLHLVEINAKPGIPGFGSIFERKPGDEPYYRRWLRPHIEFLASFLKAKVERP